MTKTYLLRTCTATGQCCDDPNAAGSRHHPFIWPESGPVEASDWTPEPKCGGGLHGLIDGQGAVDLLSTAPDARWLVVECDPADVVQIDPSKGKAKRGTVIYCGAKDGAIALLQFILPGQPIVYGTATAGDAGTATAGDAGTATAGYAGILSLRWYDGHRDRIATFYVGEDGIEPGVPYRCEAGKAVRVEKEKP